MPTRVSADEFVKAWTACGGSPAAVARATGLSIRNVYARRASLEKLNGIALPTSEVRGVETPYAPPMHFERRRAFDVPDGVVIVFSDAHFLPDHNTVGQDALEALCRKLKPVLVTCNGDALDGTQIGKWPLLSHHRTFPLREQLETMKLHMDAIQKASGKARLAYCLGNHCVRLSRYIAVQAEHFLDMPYTRLEDWIPAWPLSWTVEINPGTLGMTVIRHRNQAGMLHLQAIKAGANYIHGHLHKLNVHRVPTFNGVRYSVDTGSLADPQSDAFDYMEGNPDHAQGFAVLTFKGGKLLPPELVEVVDGTAYFRGAPV